MYVKVIIAHNDTDLSCIKLDINVSKFFAKAQHSLYRQFKLSIKMVNLSCRSEVEPVQITLPNSQTDRLGQKNSDIVGNVGFIRPCFTYCTLFEVM